MDYVPSLKVEVLRQDGLTICSWAGIYSSWTHSPEMDIDVMLDQAALALATAHFQWEYPDPIPITAPYDRDRSRAWWDAVRKFDEHVEALQAVLLDALKEAAYAYV